MSTKYLTQKWRSGAPIQAVEAVSETDKTVTIPNPYGKGHRRAPKISQYAQYHDSWEAAHAYLMERAESELESARASLQSAQSYHGNIKGLRKP